MNFQMILSEPSWILIIFNILLECKSKKIKTTILELKNPYELIFVRHPVIFFSLEAELSTFFNSLIWHYKYVDIAFNKMSKFTSSRSDMLSGTLV